MVAAGTSKIMMPWHKQMIQGFMAGAYVALGALFANLMEGKFTHYDDDDFEVAPGEANLIGGAVFPIGLIAIFMTGANLYTGNCMYIVPPLINGNVPRLRAVAWLILSWLSNFAGAGFVACVAPGPLRSLYALTASHCCWGLLVLARTGSRPPAVEGQVIEYVDVCVQILYRVPRRVDSQESSESVRHGQRYEED